MIELRVIAGSARTRAVGSYWNVVCKTVGIKTDLLIHHRLISCGTRAEHKLHPVERLAWTHLMGTILVRISD